jgi:hypothetical protein
MKSPRKNPRFNRLIAAGALAFAIGVASAWAQDTTTTSTRHGEPSISTEVKNARIVYVEGNNLVLSLENGKVEHLVVPFDEKFHVDGKEVTVRDLAPGTRLTQTITTTTTPRYVNTVRTLKGRVWHVNSPLSVILALPNGEHQTYRIPSHARFTINGQEKTAFDLKKGMKLEATIITDSEETVVSSNKTTVVRTPTLVMPHRADVLLIETPSPSVVHEPEMASVDKLPAALPQTASAVPAAGLLGLLSIATSLSLGVLRKSVKYFRG